MKPSDPTTFVSKQTPLAARGGAVTDELPAGVLEACSLPREPPHALQPEGEGPEVMMEPLRQRDPEVRRLSVAEAQAETNKAAAKAHVESMKKRTQ
ncbi:hypothetical protein D9Q98_008826 [Chlorella vulgaris]|uniref:Uncharacterized protein n=1 Tax=Chlorella vulgaris TaxID=3077 RepID=A0A9D4TIR6_CHLVU|nr:hypothetical protein D9Q98_008826 [Chlorella vulgaris]